MKKLFLATMIAMAGFVNAEEVKPVKVDESKVTKSTEVSDERKTELKVAKKLPYQWIQCTAMPCGVTYYMQMSNYDTFDDFWDANAYFNEVKCED